MVIDWNKIGPNLRDFRSVFVRPTVYSDLTKRDLQNCVGARGGGVHQRGSNSSIGCTWNW